MKINLIDIKRQYEEYQADIDAQIKTVLNDAAFIMGKQVSELEGQLAAYAGTKYAVACGSGTDALQLMLMAYGIRPGDEIITTPFTFIATAEVISLVGAKPVFVDIRRDSFNIDASKIAKAVGPRTKGIIAVDIFGQCADYDEINQIAKAHGLFVIEDAAQSFGAHYKGKMSCSLADAGCTSFFPAKPLGCYGDGGMIFLNDENVTNILKSLRGHGTGSHRYDHVRIGLNSRLDTLQAGILIAKFKHFPKEVEMRQHVADYYTRHLKDKVETPSVLSGNRSVYAQYNIVIKDRESIQKRFADAQIPTAVYYPKPLHLQPAYADLGYSKGDFPVTESICEHIMALPMHPFLTHEEQDFIINHVKG
ncbi:MAG: DegT/DnrJ/EryC1/StrS family aminotransferase [Candidatus Omnitrophica bacterium]|nr:DegT/DnrJ/EryC1/StrS family aminotransferase [Candidatus Omnitrophota bacterium]